MGAHRQFATQLETVFSRANFVFDMSVEISDIKDSSHQNLPVHCDLTVNTGLWVRSGGSLAKGEAPAPTKPCNAIIEVCSFEGFTKPVLTPLSTVKKSYRVDTIQRGDTLTTKYIMFVMAHASPGNSQRLDRRPAILQ